MFADGALDASAFFPDKLENLNGTQKPISEAEKQFAVEFTHRLKKDGFLKLCRHPITESSIDNVFEGHKFIFGLPSDEKLSLLYPGGATPARGYTPSGHEKTYLLLPELSKPSSEASECREQFTIGPLEDTSFPTPWPAAPVGSSAEQHYIAMRSFYDACRMIALRLMFALEIGLGIKPGTFVDHYGGDASEMTLNYYPPASAGRLQSRSLKRIWPHSDFGIISLLFNDGQGGLEFEDRDSPGQWVPVETKSSRGEEILIIASDTLERWTNSIIRAGVHRVGAPKALRLKRSMEGKEEPDDVDSGEQDTFLPERRSFVVVYRARGQTPVGPLACFVTSQSPAKFDDITASEYLHQKNVLTFGRG